MAKYYTKSEIRAALRRVEKGLSTGAYIHQDDLPDDEHFIKRMLKAGFRIFNMKVAAEREDCGTVACIGGWTAFELGARGPKQASNTFTSICQQYPALRRLFFNFPHDARPEDAAYAIQNFLDTKGEEGWGEEYMRPGDEFYQYVSSYSRF